MNTASPRRYALASSEEARAPGRSSSNAARRVRAGSGQVDDVWSAGVRGARLLGARRLLGRGRGSRRGRSRLLARLLGSAFWRNASACQRRGRSRALRVARSLRAGVRCRRSSGRSRAAASAQPVPGRPRVQLAALSSLQLRLLRRDVLVVVELAKMLIVLAWVLRTGAQRARERASSAPRAPGKGKPRRARRPSSPSRRDAVTRREVQVHYRARLLCCCKRSPHMPAACSRKLYELGRTGAWR